MGGEGKVQHPVTELGMLLHPHPLEPDQVLAETHSAPLPPGNVGHRIWGGGVITAEYKSIYQ